jgi:3-dehydroquinate dehydratase-2
MRVKIITLKRHIPMKNIMVIHGPNLNLLGYREPEIYGSTTLSQLNEMIKKEAGNLDISIRTFQSNSEGLLIDFIHKHREWADGVLINPGALTHYSYSLRDALASISKPVVEIHISDIHSREEFRKISVIKDICISQISGLGIDGYIQGLKLLADTIK